MSHKIHKAFILAAGFGKRMRPLTETTPKPLLQIGGRTLLDHTLDRLEAAGVEDVVINTHYLAEQIEEHLAGRTSIKIHFSREEELLDTGGGIKNTLDHFGDDPFYVLSGDGFWTEGPEKPALERLAEFWDPAQMDILMLLQPKKSMFLTTGVGDYHLEPEGRAIRAHDKRGAYMFTSIRITNTQVFGMTPNGPFSYLELMDKSQKRGRLYGLVHEGDWHHISTPHDLEAVDQRFSGSGQQLA